ALAAFLLFSAYMDEVGAYLGHPFEAVNIAIPEVFVGGLLGAMLVFLFSAWTIQAVGKAAQAVINEVRRQFREHPGIMEGTDKPNYGLCVSIVTESALKEMVRPGLLVVSLPIVVGLVFRQIGSWTGNPILGAEAVAALLMIGTIAGVLMGSFLNNSGGSWDNAKKFIEMGNLGGKGSEAHKAAVTGDTVGDPFKDTAGPSLHVLVKLLATVTLVLAPFFLAM
ncbi:MAG: sodium-translocating pyrophosphatase, partial [Acidobacteria bacterium]|nr:sodium-translocating pyrophosphatase [Acidobacteriota bacterium]